MINFNYWGQVYEGDCIDLLADLAENSVDMVLCDLPYGTTQCKWDTPLDLNALWDHYRRVVKPSGAIVLFAQTPFDKVLGASNLQDLKYEWIWEKTHATGHLNAKKMPMKAHENILVFYRQLPTYNPQKTTGHPPTNHNIRRISTQNNTALYGKATQELVSGGLTDRYPRSVQTFKKDVQTSKDKPWMHPTQKPLALCEYLIQTYTNEGDTVLDNCAGSGSTLIAALNLKRRFVGIEKDTRYFGGICERVKHEKERLSHNPLDVFF